MKATGVRVSLPAILFLLLIISFTAGCLGEETGTPPQSPTSTLPQETAAPHFSETPRPTIPPTAIPTTRMKIPMRA